MDVLDLANDDERLASEYSVYRIKNANLEFGGAGNTKTFKEGQLAGWLNDSWTKDYSYKDSITNEKSSVRFRLYIIDVNWKWIYSYLYHLNILVATEHDLN